MPAFVEKVQATVRERTGLFANWLPTDPLNIGAFGYVNNGILVKEGNLSDIGVEFNTRFSNSSSSTIGFSHDTTLDFTAKGLVSPSREGSVNCEVTFEREGALVYHLTGLKSAEFETKAQTYLSLVTRAFEQKLYWPPYYVLVDEIRKAENSTILVSQTSDAGITLSAEASMSLDSDAPLAELSGKVVMRKSNGSIFQSISKRNTTPLFSARRIGFKDSDEVGFIDGLSAWFFRKFQRSYDETVPIRVVNFDLSTDTEVLELAVNKEHLFLEAQLLSPTDFLDGGGPPTGNDPSGGRAAKSSTNVLRAPQRAAKKVGRS